MACFEISRQSHPNTPAQFLILAQGGGTATDEETKQPQHHCQECGYLHQGLDREKNLVQHCCKPEWFAAPHKKEDRPHLQVQQITF
jgi:hypothetical protein